jgi:hypothetical protein
MTPREYDAIITGLREYREEEARIARESMSQASGKQTTGGQTITNR